MNRILIIEDDEHICRVIEAYFTAKGADIKIINNGSDACEYISEGLQGFDLVLLDIMLPCVDGFSICRLIRRISDIPIVFITARGREEDVLYGYDLGCDDYIVKPFSLAALYAKCEALIKRSGGLVINTMLECGDIRLDTRMLRCFAGGIEIDLPPKEFAILRYLMEHQNWVVDRNTLLNCVWGYDYFGSDRVVDNHIKKLRRALGSAGGQIKTVVSRGYKLTKTG